MFLPSITEVLIGYAGVSAFLFVFLLWRCAPKIRRGLQHDEATVIAKADYLAYAIAWLVVIVALWPLAILVSPVVTKYLEQKEGGRE